MKFKLLHIIKEFSYIPITIVIAWIVFAKVIVIGYIPTESMEPNYMAGSVFVGIRMIDRDSIERGTPVLFKHYDDIFVKRVIGLPGETISFSYGAVCIDGTTLDESAYIDASVFTESDTEEFTVPAGCYMMLGDNRAESYDSRYWTDPYTPADDIVGRLLFAIKIK